MILAILGRVSSSSSSSLGVISSYSNSCTYYRISSVNTVLLQARTHSHRKHEGTFSRRKSSLSKPLLPTSKNNPKKTISIKSTKPSSPRKSFWFTDLWRAPKTDNLEYLNKASGKKLYKPKQVSIVYDVDSPEFTKPDEVICIEKEILPEHSLLNQSVKQEKPLGSNIISVCNKLGKHQIEIVTPNIKNGILATSHIGVPSVIIRNLKLFPMMSNQRATVASNVSNDGDQQPEDKVLRVASGDSDHKEFPSVTKILTQTMSVESKAALEKWKQEKIAEMGVEGFEKFNKAQLANGAQFHNLLSQYLLAPQSISSIEKPLEGVWSSVGHLLKNVNKPKAVESHVIHPVLKYRGIIDCIAMYQDKPTLIEWKKSDKQKTTLGATYDNPVQLAAYFGAISHDPNYKNFNVRDALLVVAYTDGSPADVFPLSTEQMRQHWATWLTRLERYWTANSEPSSPTEQVK